MGAILTLGSVLCPTCKIDAQSPCKIFKKKLQVFLVPKEFLPLDHPFLKELFLLCSWLELKDFPGVCY